MLKLTPMIACIAGMFALHSCAPTVKEAVEEAPKIGKFINVSDLHFNPYYDTTLVAELVQSPYTEWEAIYERSGVTSFSSYDHDSNYPLIRSALDKMKEELPSPDFIMISGDFLSHHFEDDFTTYAKVSFDEDQTEDFSPLHAFNEKTMRFIAQLITDRFPETPVIATLGNNDAYCGDYLVQPGKTFLTMLSGVWKPLLHTENTGTFDSTFREAGYFAMSSPINANHKMIVLNSILFSTKFNNGDGQTPYCDLGDYGADNDTPGLKQLDWLDGQLAKAQQNDEKVWLMQHIPPGMNVFGALPKSDTACIGNENAYYWKPVFTEKYMELIQKYSAIITTNMAGHYHRDDFRLMLDESGEPISYMHILPAVSPIYYNNPGFEVVEYDLESTVLKDYTTYYTNVKTQDTTQMWSLEYRFSETYDQSELSPTSMKSVLDSLGKSEALAEKYMLYYPVSESVDMKDLKYYLCGITNFTPADFKECVCSK